MVDQVEKVARAIWREDHYDPKLCDDMHYCKPNDDDLSEWPADHEKMLRMARAAITAYNPNERLREALETIREPNYDMLHAALREARRHDPPLLPSCKEIWASEVIWRAMIDAALSHKETNNAGS